MKNGANQDESLPTLRRFGWTLGVMFPLIFGLVGPALFHRILPVWPWIVGAVFGALGSGAPGLLRIPYRIWMALGALLHRVNTVLIFTLVFFLVLCPLNLCFRLVGRDALRRRWDPNATTYRIEISDSQLVDRMDNLF